MKRERPARVNGPAVRVRAACMALLASAPGACRPQCAGPGRPVAAQTLRVVVEVPGKTGDELEASVTRALEGASEGLARVAHRRSVSEDGVSSLDLELEPGADVRAVREPLQRRLAEVARSLPAVAEAPRVLSGVGRPVLRLVMSSQVLPASQLTALQRSTVAPRLQKVPGVARVATCGGGLPSTLVEVDPQQLVAYGVTIADVFAGLSAAASPTPSPSPSPSPTPSPSPAMPATHGAAALGPLVLAVRNGAPIRLNDLARLSDDAVEPRCLVSDTRRVVSESLVYAAGSVDPAALAAALEAQVPQLRAELPQAVDLTPVPIARELTVGLVPDMVPIVALQRVRDGVTTQAPSVRFLIELGAGDDEAGDDGAPDTLRVLLESADPSEASRVLAALQMVPMVRAGEANATVRLLGDDRAALKVAGAGLVARLNERGALVATLGLGERASTRFVVDTATATRLGVTQADVDLVLAVREGKAVDTLGAEVPVVVRFIKETGPDLHLSVRGKEGTIPLDALAHREVRGAPPALLRVDGRAMVGARVHADDLAGLKTAYVPPPGIELQVVEDSVVSPHP